MPGSHGLRKVITTADSSVRSLCQHTGILYYTIRQLTRHLAELPCLPCRYHVQLCPVMTVFHGVVPPLRLDRADYDASTKHQRSPARSPVQALVSPTCKYGKLSPS